MGLGILTILIGVGLALYQQHQNTQATKVTAATGTRAPAVTKPTANAFNDYAVPPDAPRYIYIPKINVKAIVRPLGITKTGQIDAPNNVYDAGWFTQSSKPGQLGATLVDGHISSWQTHGIFYNLKDLKPGNTVILERGDGVKISYQVIKSQTYSYNNVDMAAVLSPIQPDTPGLNLITCSGAVIKGTNEFNERLVVFTKQI